MRKAVLLGALAAVMLFGIVGLAVADVVTYPGSGNPNSAASNSANPVEVKATVNPKITLTIDTPDPGQEVLFGAVDPETEYTDSVGLQVKSNKTYDLAVVKGGQSALIGLTTDLQAGLTDQAKGTNTYTDDYKINVPYTTDPGNYVATVQYTVTQK